MPFFDLDGSVRETGREYNEQKSGRTSTKSSKTELSLHPKDAGDLLCWEEGGWFLARRASRGLVCLPGPRGSLA